MESTWKKFEKLVNLMKTLRSKKGCPWDRKQNHTSIKHCLVDEVCEVIEAIDHKNPEKLKEELGDLLYQIIFHARIAEERGRFSINDVLENIYQKLIRRHPHVFGTKKIKTAEKVLDYWHKHKIKEEKQKGNKSIVDNIPHTLPALYKAIKVQKKVSTVGFDWKNPEEVINKIEEELQELKEEIKAKKRGKIKEELGDLLFSIANLGRFLKIDPEDALHQTVNKFITRFRKMERVLQESGKPLEETPLEEMEHIWNTLKAEFRGQISEGKVKAQGS